ncbi:MAG: bifunctional 2-C-methyl-D-erythritol 4-phosphate cytidylyltransferase/2-C-methyl-D-erythritol 2,4-cyclodiphosphate synthase [Campylobacterales bacterium]|nr:bifunctional 2-C-methyl-D-erythritol 4-phosphate cytidylyltransferase/2-C-methyl-D-erythritol 2,4-cyclodiphosphate synthase [Campylobacterales bacterium]
MSDTTLVMLCAGNSSRFSMDVKKQWLRIDHEPLWSFVTKRISNQETFSDVIIVAAADEIEFMKNYAEYTFVQGGNTRQESLQNALTYVNSEYVLVSDVARACTDKKLLKRILEQKGTADTVVPYLNVTDTITYKGKTIDREEVKRIQTPQLSKTLLLKEALLTGEEFTDDSSAIVANGGTRAFVYGDEEAHKITFAYDLNKLSCLQAPSNDTLSGNGFDVHAFDDKGEMWLGGVKIAADFGFKAHSDGDVAIHSLIDALLGAAGMGDIGMMFPDSDAQYKGADSKELLKRVVSKLYSFGYMIINVDITIAAQTPRLANYKQEMRKVLANILHIDMSRVNVKATTTEKLGFVGRAEGVAVLANANLKYFNWKDIG